MTCVRNSSGTAQALHPDMMSDPRSQKNKVNCAACCETADGFGCGFHRQVAVGHFIPLSGMKFDRIEGDLVVFSSHKEHGK